MKLGIFFTIGSGFKDQKKSGQDKRFIEYYLKRYNENFKKVYVFSYLKEKQRLPKNCYLIDNKYHLNRFIYAFFIPLLNFKKIKGIDVFRVMQLTGVVPALIVKLLFNKPFVFTYGFNYEQIAKIQGQKIRPLLIKILEKLALKFCSAVIITNKQNEQYLIKKYSQINLNYIPNGVNIDQFKPSSSIIPALPCLAGRQAAGRQQSRLRQGFGGQASTRILFVGRLEKEKNLFNLVKAVALLSPRYQIQLIFIGRGTLKNQLQSVAKEFRVKLKIIDKVPHYLLPKYYQEADIFCLVSFSEGAVKTLLEAMSCGLPCLVSRYPGAEEFIDKKEILLTDFDAKKIADNLEILIKNNQLKKILGQNARKKIVENYDITTLLKKESDLLKQIANLKK